MGSDPRQVRAAPLSRTWHQADQSHHHFLLPQLSPLPLSSSSPPPHPRPDPPRDVSSVELLMKYHQGIRAEIETRSKNFNACLELGESLLQREHQASEEVRGTVGQPAFSVLAPTLAGPDSFLARLIFLSSLESPTTPTQGLAAW